MREFDRRDFFLYAYFSVISGCPRLFFVVEETHVLRVTTQLRLVGFIEPLIGRFGQLRVYHHRDLLKSVCETGFGSTPMAV